MKVNNAEKDGFMQLHENTRFLLLTLGVFCLTLGTAVSLFTLIAHLLYEVNFGKSLLMLSASALLLGGLLLRYGRHRLI